MADCDCKTCTKCGQSKNTSEFGKQKRRKDGLNPWCKACKSAAGKIYFAANKERLRPIRAAWNAANPEKRRASTREHQARWRKADPVAYYAYMAQYRTPEVIRAYSRSSYRRNREKSLASGKRYRAANAASVSAQKAEYRAANPELHAALKRSYKARKRGAGGSHSGQDIKTLFILQKGRCAHCRASIQNGYHVDHMKPLSKGGSNDRLNLQLLCKRCNLSKSDKDPLVFANESGRLL